jgi:hypothetical protein
VLGRVMLGLSSQEVYFKSQKWGITLMYVTTEWLALAVYLPVALIIYQADRYYFSSSKEVSQLKAAFLSAVISPIVAILIN